MNERVMLKRTFFFALGLLLTSNAVGMTDSHYASVRLRVAKYDIGYTVDFKNELLSARCAMTVYNPGDTPVDTVSLLLYRLLSVDSALFADGRAVGFDQSVQTFSDWPVMQQNYIRLSPDKPIRPDDSLQIVIYYSGHLLGYTETGMLYVRDKIDTNFMILRPDCGAYPELGVPSWKTNRAVGLQQFDYVVSVTLPKPLVAANGGRLVEARDLGKTGTYTFVNTKPAWRIDVAIARYRTIDSGQDRVYYFPEDQTGAHNVVGAMERTLRLYSKWWGRLPGYRGFAIIEIPDGWGSQADVSSILQTAAAFKDAGQMYQLYHELSHQWNTASLDSFPPRWEEGFATFMQYLTMDKLEGDSALDKATDRILKSVKKELSESPDLATTALIDFGRANHTDFSYTMGMLLFRLMYDLVGEDEFHSTLGSFFQKYRDSGATTREFAEYLKSASGGRLDHVVDDWILTSGYARTLRESDRWTQVEAAYK